MTTSGYISFDDIRLDTGTKVFYHEIQALKKVTDLKFVIAKGYSDTDANFIPLDFEKYYPFNPFLADYFAAQLLPSKVDFLHLACSPGSAILAKARPKKYTVHIMAHDLKESIAEHERMFGPGSYNLLHNTDEYLHSLLLAHVEGASAVVTASTPAAKWIHENTKAKRIAAIPHGADLPLTTQSLPSIFRVGYLGAFGPDKGLPYLIHAWKNFNRDNSELVFAGNCGQVLTTPEFQKFFFAGVPNVKIPGRVKDISDFYNNISVYVQPSVTEGFGIEIPEAMAFGRPVIVTSTTGGKDLVDDGINGFIVPPRDPQAILERLMFFYNNPNETRIMGERARNKMSKYSWADIEHTYTQFYTAVLEDN
jgi:glycosyltransferase involved in cell wall biosynthesis